MRSPAIPLWTFPSQCSRSVGWRGVQNIDAMRSKATVSIKRVTKSVTPYRSWHKRLAFPHGLVQKRLRSKSSAVFAIIGIIGTEGFVLLTRCFSLCIFKQHLFNRLRHHNYPVSLIFVEILSGQVFLARCEQGVEII
jgi:hypothetical protein